MDWAWAAAAGLIIQRSPIKTKRTAGRQINILSTLDTARSSEVTLAIKQITLHLYWHIKCQNKPIAIARQHRTIKESGNRIKNSLTPHPFFMTRFALIAEKPGAAQKRA
jgi:hypothetical protein